MGRTAIGRFCRDSSSCAKSKSRRRGEERCRGDGWRGRESVAFTESAPNLRNYFMAAFVRNEGYVALRYLFYKDTCSAFCDWDKIIQSKVPFRDAMQMID